MGLRPDVATTGSATASPTKRPSSSPARPATRPVVRAGEPIARPMARPAAGDSRAPNLFQRITGAFSSPPKGMTPAVMTAPLVEPSVARPVAVENVVAVAPKAPPPRPAPVQANFDVTERAKPARDDDDLQIPAFLRRQAN